MNAGTGQTKAEARRAGGKDNYFSGFAALITSAAASVLIVFGLFNSVFATLVPPLIYKEATLGWLSLCGLVLLLALTVIFTAIRGAALSVSAAVTSLTFAVGALLTYVPYVSELRTHVYQVPPPPAEKAQRYVRGELHPEGVRRLGMNSVDSFASKDLDAVLNTEVLWTQKSRHSVSSRLEGLYVALVSLMLAAIFTSGVCLWSIRRPRGR